ncbi:methionine synthase [Aeromicrobium sp. CFBP 8757]|uniref:methionine synthase n=1 Tax=Aeromicrobium sp. CFBP 8757 TaxID=2775288 RepID=UPI001783AB86|nr:methionine synthase [Aeromicrobium sp. CFBP 8757]MBD8608035.1 methionine synthase [Aeromicrobium sp. CFBP 8757]
MALATGIGSMPGTDFTESLRVVLDTVGDLPFVPELPGRGVHAGMIGRTLSLLSGLEADLQPDGWRVGVGEGGDVRRARSLLAQDLDVAEELAQGHTGPLKIQVTGPLTLAATVERPRGDKMLADHGARREIGESLAEGLRGHVADVRRRFADADLVVQVDEPAIAAVLTGGIPTASGFSRHRSVHPPEADAILRTVVDAIVAGGARPVVHSCAPDVPVELLAGAGFTAIAFDLSLVRPDDVWAETFEKGIDLWFGVVPSTDAAGTSDKDLAARVRTFLDRFGFDVEQHADRLVVSPTCGLAGASPPWAARALTLAAAAAQRLEG